MPFSHGRGTSPRAGMMAEGLAATSPGQPRPAEQACQASLYLFTLWPPLYPLISALLQPSSSPQGQAPSCPATLSQRRAANPRAGGVEPPEPHNSQCGGNPWGGQRRETSPRAEPRSKAAGNHHSPKGLIAKFGFLRHRMSKAVTNLPRKVFIGPAAIGKALISAFFSTANGWPWIDQKVPAVPKYPGSGNPGHPPTRLRAQGHQNSFWCHQGVSI